MDNFAPTLIASLIWGSIGLGFLIYGKKQSAMVPFCGGIVMVGISYFVASALWMSLSSAAVMVMMVVAIKRGY